MVSMGKRKNTFVCRKCCNVYVTRKSKEKSFCPKCGRPHHTHKGWGVWVQENRMLIK